MDESSEVQVATPPTVAEASSQPSDAAPVHGQVEHQPDGQDRHDASAALPKKKKPRSKPASPGHARAGATPSWLPLALIAAAGVGLAAAARAIMTMQHRRSRRMQHQRAFAQRFHMEASEPASNQLSGARLVVDQGYVTRPLAFQRILCVSAHHTARTGWK